MLSFNNRILFTSYLFVIMYCDTYFPTFVIHNFAFFAHVDCTWFHLGSFIHIPYYLKEAFFFLLCPLYLWYNFLFVYLIICVVLEHWTFQLTYIMSPLYAHLVTDTRVLKFCFSLFQILFFSLMFSLLLFSVKLMDLVWLPCA